MRVLSVTKSQPLALLAVAALLAACGGARIEGRYTPRGDAFFESLTLGAEGRVDVVFIGQPAVGSYVVDGSSITLTGPTGDKVAFVVGDDGCLTNSIAGRYCRAGDAPSGGGGSSGGAVAAGGGATSGPEAYEAVMDQGRLRIELISESQARMTMRPNAPGGDLPAQMSFDVFYERDGGNLLVALPGEEPMRLVRDGRDYLATMDGETARFVRQ
jgi:hypothetical protein